MKWMQEPSVTVMLSACRSSRNDPVGVSKNDTPNYDYYGKFSRSSIVRKMVKAC